MPTEPIEEYIPREIDNPDLKRVLDQLSSLIDEVVNRSSHLFKWSIESIRAGDENVPAMLMFRNIFELIDSISVLIKNSCIEPCYIILRSLFESFLNFNYLFENNFKTKGMDFLVCYRHKEIESLRRFDPKDELYIRYQEKKARDQITKDIPQMDVPDIDERLSNIKKMFDLPSYKESNDEYERIKSAHRGKPPKHWFSMHGGPNDTYQLADRLGFPAQYEILYRSWSGSVHGTDILKDKFSIEGPGLVSFTQLRFPAEAPFVALMAITFGLSAIRIFTIHYLPDIAKDNAEWYKREVQSTYQNLNKIKIVIVEGAAPKK